MNNVLRLLFCKSVLSVNALFFFSPSFIDDKFFLKTFHLLLENSANEFINPLQNHESSYCEQEHLRRLLITL